MSESTTKLLLVIPIRVQEDLDAVVQSEDWHTVKDLFKKTGTSYNTHWNGNYVLDQDEIPWKVSPEEIAALTESEGRVIVVSEGKYGITGSIPLYSDRDGSVYVLEKDVEEMLA
jgi:hypothetical protein